MYEFTYIKQLLVYFLKVATNSSDLFIRDFQRHIRSQDKPAVSLIKSCYYKLLDDNTPLQYTSPGAGPRRPKKNLTISEHAKRTAVNSSKGNLLLQVAAFYKPELIIELGTSFGFSTMYLAKGNPQSRIVTVEGNPQIAGIAESIFIKNNFSNVEVINALFDTILPELVHVTNSNTMVFIDGNHTYEATIKYINAFSNAKLIILDDIRWSSGMMQAWKDISERGEMTVIDLFSVGIIINNGTRRIYHLLL